MTAASGRNGAADGVVRLLAAMALCLPVSLALASYPLGPVWLGAGLACYAAVLWFDPLRALFFVPCLLPVLNLSPWSGWLFVEEFDLLMLVSLAVAMVRGRERGPLELVGRWMWRVIVFFGACFALSVLVGVLPLEPPEAEALSSYYSRYNALRVAKGFVWALLFLPLMRRGLEMEKGRRFFTAGMLAGLALVVAGGVWERYAFPGFFNFTDDYRITSTFPEMHVGGESIDGYLALTLPFIAACFVQWRGWLVRLAGAALLLLGLYTLLVTYSRIGVASLAVSVVVLVVGLVSARSRGRGVKPAGGAVLVIVAVSALGAASVANAQYLQERFARTSDDLRDRIAQWRSAVTLMDSDVRTFLFGMGAGSYPRSYVLGNRRDAASIPFRFITEEGNRLLRLGTGDSLYFGQRVALRQGERYTVSLDVRSASDHSLLAIPVCEKSLLYSAACASLSVRPGNTGEKWVRHTLELRTDDFGIGGSRIGRPVEFALSNGGKGSSIDVDNVSLVDSSGREFIHNGSFSDGGARWFFTVDNYVPWHVENLWVHVLFEQGWCGVLSLCLFVGCGFANLVARIRRGDKFAAILLASLTGSLVVGLTASLVDAPRIGALFFMVLFAAMMRPAALSSKGGF